MVAPDRQNAPTARRMVRGAAGPGCQQAIIGRAWAERARSAVAIARQDLDHAIAAVIAASPELAGLRAAYETTRQHLSALTGALRAAGHPPPLGIMRMDETAFANSEWEIAVRGLHEDPDTPLPATERR